MHFKEVGCDSVDRIQLTEDRFRGQALENMLMDLWCL